MAVDLTARETEVIRILDVLHSSFNKFVVIGGYAVSALGTHRFSVDCDVVISEKDLPGLEKILEREGYRKTKVSNVGTHGSKTAKYSKLIGGRRVSVDIGINSIVCRNTEGEWSYELLSKNSTEMNIVGVTGSTTALVPRKELLIAMKLHPARDTDLRDVVILRDDVDWRAVAEFTDTGITRKVVAQLDSAIERIASKMFPSALKAEFGLRVDVTSAIEETIKELKMVREILTDKKTLASIKKSLNDIKADRYKDYRSVKQFKTEFESRT
ncbi:MAG: hypothetical protein ABSE82_01290 [Nitrososphaerales archaeon]